MIGCGLFYAVFHMISIKTRSTHDPWKIDIDSENFKKDDSIPLKINIETLCI